MLVRCGGSLRGPAKTLPVPCCNKHMDTLLQDDWLQFSFSELLQEVLRLPFAGCWAGSRVRFASQEQRYMPYWVYGPCSDAFFLHARLCLLVVVYSKVWLLLKASIQWFQTEFRKFHVLAGTSSQTTPAKLCTARLCPLCFHELFGLMFLELESRECQQKPRVESQLKFTQCEQFGLLLQNAFKHFQRFD